MGACCSRQQDLYIDVPRVNSTTDVWALRPKSFLGGCKLLPFTASCPVSYPYQSLTRVVLGEDHLFAALWEGHGGSQAARHCVSKCYETLLGCMKGASDPFAALMQTTKELDKSYFASDIPDLVKAGVGATGVMMYIDTRNNQCYIARMGDSLPFMAESKGSFNNITVDVKPLSTGQSHRVLFTDLGASNRSSNDRSAAYAVADLEGPSTYTHAIGLGFGKDKKLQQLWLKQEATAGLKQFMSSLPFISNSCEVSRTQLDKQHETIVLASEGLLGVLTPHEAGLLLHHFNAAKLNKLKQTIAAAAAQQEELNAASQQAAAEKSGKGKSKGKSFDKENQGAASKVPNKPNVANIVMHHAISKVIDQFNLAMEQHHQADFQERVPKLTYQELSQLPLNVDKEAFRPAGAKSSQVQLHLPKHYHTGGLGKNDVHQDMGLVVIALDWPRSVDSQPLPGISPLKAGKAIRPDARYRWQLLRSSVKFHIAYRRSLRTRWWRLIEEAHVAAEEAARHKEVVAWKTKGEAVKVNMAGEELDPDTPTRVRNSLARSVHNSPLKLPVALAGRGGSRILSTGRVAAAVAAFDSAPSSSKPATKLAGSSRIPAVPGISAGVSSSDSAFMAVASRTPYAAPATGDQNEARASSSCARLRPLAPAGIEIGSRFDESVQESDVDASQIDSPNKTAAKQSFPLHSAKKAAPGSPSKPYGKQNLSLRGHAPGLPAEGSTRSIDTRDHSPAQSGETGWNTPKQIRGSSSGTRPSFSGGAALPDVGRRLAGSPVKSMNKTPPMSREGSNSMYASARGSGGRVGSPSKLNRAGKISLRASKPAAHC